MITSPFAIILTDIEQARLTKPSLLGPSRAPDWCCGPGSCWPPPRQTSNAAIAAETGLHVDTVRKWRRRFVQDRLAGLSDRPPVRPAAQVHRRPGRRGQGAGLHPARRDRSRRCRAGRSADLAAEAVRRGVARLDLGLHGAPLADRGRDQTLAAPVLDLPPRPRLRGQSRPGAGPLRPQLGRRTARRRRLRDQRRREIPAPSPAAAATPGSPPGPGQTRRVEFEYRRGGTLAYLAAYDVHHAHVIGHIAPKTGIEPFTELVDQVMTSEPYASARRVFWVVDNGSSHRGWRSIDRMEQAWPTATLVHLPVHASWLNQIEIYFSILQRKAITPADFADLDHLAERILAFQDRYNQTATPFDWTLHPHRPQRLPPPNRSPHNPRRTYGDDH